VTAATRPWQRWIAALKPASWAKLLVPAALGQTLGVLVAGGLSVPGLLVGLAFTVADLVCVVLLNDWGDQRVDAIKRTLFPEGCAPKTIPDRLLPARSVLYAGLGAGALAWGIAVFGQEFLGRPGLAWGGVGCLALFWAYTLPPLRLNYRGGGEVLEMLGVGVALPLFNAYVQAGQGVGALGWLLPGYALLAFSSALASGLADEESDRLGGKRTFTTIYGNAAVRRAAEACALGGYVWWVLVARVAPDVLPPWAGWVVGLVVFPYWRGTRRLSARAATNAFAAQRVYKGQLHKFIVRGTLALCGCLLLHAAVRGDAARAPAAGVPASHAGGER
jgi:1,4-dihydroxy-2-naphthoate octaprenyltransferase/chlorophyll synthase